MLQSYDFAIPNPEHLDKKNLSGHHLSHLLPGSLDNPFHRIHSPDFAEGADNGIELLNAADSKSNLYNGISLPVLPGIQGVERHLHVGDGNADVCQKVPSVLRLDLNGGLIALPHLRRPVGGDPTLLLLGILAALLWAVGDCLVNGYPKAASDEAHNFITRYGVAALG